MQVNITQVEHFKTPSCTRFSHSSLTLPWPSLRRNRGLLVPSTGHLSLVVHASWEYEMTCSLTATQRCRYDFHTQRENPKNMQLDFIEKLYLEKTRDSSCTNKTSDIIKCRKRSFTPLIPRIRFQHFEIISEKVSSFQKPILSILIITEFEKTLFTKDSSCLLPDLHKLTTRASPRLPRMFLHESEKIVWQTVLRWRA